MDELKKKELATATSAVTPGGIVLRAQMLDLALRTPGIGNFNEALKAAEAYRAYLTGNTK